MIGPQSIDPLNIRTGLNIQTHLRNSQLVLPIGRTNLIYRRSSDLCSSDPSR